MITRNALCPNGCGEILLRTEQRGRVTYSNKNGKRHHCSAQFDVRNATWHGYVSDGCGCVERVF